MTIRKTEAIKNFLNLKTLKDLADLYNEEMEVQVNVRQGKGIREVSEFKGKIWNHYTDGINKWAPFRIPINAATEPHYDLNSNMSYDLMEHCEAIGMTGWNWIKKESFWVAYDFDSLIGHSERHSRKLSDSELGEINEKVRNISWVQVRKSTSGKGLHLYVFLGENIRKQNNTKTHTEHSALARSILGTLSAICNYDFSARVDAYGGNMWIFHRKQEGTDGLNIIKNNIELLDRIPPDWREHIHVVSGRRNRTMAIPKVDLENSKSSLEDDFEEICGLRTKVKLDSVHQKLLTWLSDHGHYCVWNSERWLLITHTYSLKQAHQALNMKGPFETISPSTDLNTPNAFCFPCRGGWWSVKRYSPNIEEASTWFLDSSSWRTCFLNREPNLEVASRIHGGVKDQKGKFVFDYARDAVKTIKELGINIEIPSEISLHSSNLKTISSGEVVIEIIQEGPKDHTLSMDDWVNNKKGKFWERTFYNPNRDNNENDVDNTVTHDDTVRHLVSEDGTDLGWMIKTENNWNHYNTGSNAKLVLEGHFRYSVKETKAILGGNIIKPWILVNRPFQPEYTVGREWNLHAAKFKYTPSPSSENLNYPTWNLILNHLGKNIDQSVSKNQWCSSNGILTGSNYLKCWIASLFQNPYAHLPYLFFYGPEDCGKSALHESLAELMTKGYVRADQPLVNQQGFNGELEGAILAIIEELNIKEHKAALNRMKDWVNAKTISIHFKNKTPYMVDNTLHFIQISNDINYVPIMTGDTRVTIIEVSPLNKANEIPRHELTKRIIKEAPDFLRSVLDIELPNPTGRLAIPVIETEDKETLQETNKDPVTKFLEEYYYYVPGQVVLQDDLYQRFLNYIGSADAHQWTKIMFGKKIPKQFPKGKWLGNPNNYVGNLSAHPNQESGTKLICVNQRLVPETCSENNHAQNSDQMEKKLNDRNF